jgi:hypothetical protein
MCLSKDGILYIYCRYSLLGEVDERDKIATIFGSWMAFLCTKLGLKNEWGD